MPPPSSNTSSHRARRTVWACIRFAIGIGLVAYLVRSGVIDLVTMRRLSKVWPITLAALVLLNFDVLLMSLRFSWLLRPHGLHLPLGKSMQITYVSFFFTTFLPGLAGGVLAKLFYAGKENAARTAEIATVVIFDRAIGALSLLLLSLMFVPVFPHLAWSVPELRVLVLVSAVLAVTLIAGFFVILVDGARSNSMTRRVLALLPWKQLTGRIFDTILFYRNSVGVVLASLVVSLVANFGGVCMTALAMIALEPSSYSSRLFLVAPLGYIANTLPLTPGGLGVGETAFDSLFKLEGLGGGADALLCWRIWSLPIALVGLVFYLRGLGRSVHQKEREEVTVSDS